MTTQTQAAPAATATLNLLARIFAVDLSVQRHFALEPASPDDEVLGTMSIHLQSFYVVRDEIMKELEGAVEAATLEVIEHQNECDGGFSEACQAMHKRRDEITAMFSAVKRVERIFDDALRLEFPLLTKNDTFEFRENFEVVAIRGGREAEHHANMGAGDFMDIESMLAEAMGGRGGEMPTMDVVIIGGPEQGVDLNEIFGSPRRRGPSITGLLNSLMRPRGADSRSRRSYES